MVNIFGGLAFFITGLIIWGVSSAGKAVSEVAKIGGSGMTFFMKLGFIFMIGGPVLFWVIRPIQRLKRGRHELVARTETLLGVLEQRM